MGYLGSVCLNGESIFLEEKDNESTFCIEYARTYCGTLDTKLTKKEILDCISELNSIPDNYINVCQSINVGEKIIRDLSLVAQNIYSVESFDENWNFLYITKLQNLDCYGNNQAIYFYEPENVSNVSEVEFGQRIKISDDELADIKRKSLLKISCVDLGTILCTTKIENRQKKVEDLINILLNIKDIEDILDLIDYITQIVFSLYEKHRSVYETTRNMTNLLFTYLDYFKNGDELFVKHIGHKLILSNKTQLIKNEIECSNLFFVSKLFSRSEALGFCCSVTIKSIKELDVFISSFEEASNRSAIFENMFKEIRNKIANNQEKFTLIVNGSY